MKGVISVAYNLYARQQTRMCAQLSFPSSLNKAVRAQGLSLGYNWEVLLFALRAGS